MSYQNGTTHYNLPLTVSSDRRDWADTNQAFQNIDAALHGAVTDVATAGANATEALTKVAAAEGNITQAQSDITQLQASDTTQDTSILNLQNRVTAIENKDIEVTFTDGTVGVFLSTIGALTAGTYLVESLDGTIIVTDQRKVVSSARVGDASGNISLFNIRNTANTVYGRVDFNTAAGTTTYQCHTGTEGDAILTPFGTSIRLYRIH